MEREMIVYCFVCNGDLLATASGSWFVCLYVFLDVCVDVVVCAYNYLDFLLSFCTFKTDTQFIVCNVFRVDWGPT